MTTPGTNLIDKLHRGTIHPDISEFVLKLSALEEKPAFLALLESIGNATEQAKVQYIFDLSVETVQTAAVRPKRVAKVWEAVYVHFPLVFRARIHHLCGLLLQAGEDSLQLEHRKALLRTIKGLGDEALRTVAGELGRYHYVLA